MFALTPRFKHATSVLNSIDTVQAAFLFKLLEDKMSKIKGDAWIVESEISKLSTKLKINIFDLTTIIDVCTFIFEKAAYEGIASDSLSGELFQAGMDKAKCDFFCKVWKHAKPQFINRLAKRTISGPAILSAFSWKVNMNVGKNSVAKLQKSSIIFYFNTQNVNNNVSEFAITLSHENLYRFFASLELIQKQLDTLS
jgi:hypothetical protein